MNWSSWANINVISRMKKRVIRKEGDVSTVTIEKSWENFHLREHKAFACLKCLKFHVQIVRTKSPPWCENNCLKFPILMAGVSFSLGCRTQIWAMKHWHRYDMRHDITRDTTIRHFLKNKDTTLWGYRMRSHAIPPFSS